MTIKQGINSNNMQNSSLKREDLKGNSEALNNQNQKIEPKEQSQGQIKSYSTFLGTNIDIRV